MSKYAASRQLQYLFRMRQRAYGQYCGLARAVEILGERWALLIVRDLLVRPRRFTDLRDGLPGIPTNVLSARLKELASAGVVVRRLLPAPERAVVYALTDDGRTLDDAVLGLARWGATRLGDPRPGEIVTADSLVIALRTTFQPDAAAGLTAAWEIHVGDIVLHAVVDDGRLQANVGPSPRPPDLVIAGSETEPPPLKALLNRELTAEEAITKGAVRLTGTAGLLATFAETFRIR
jgi:DNA-binding HxlR family transcriptional regulator